MIIVSLGGLKNMRELKAQDQQILISSWGSSAGTVIKQGKKGSYDHLLLCVWDPGKSVTGLDSDTSPAPASLPFPNSWERQPIDELVGKPLGQLWAELRDGQLSRWKETGADCAEGPAQENVTLQSSHKSGSLQKGKGKTNSPHCSSSEGCIQQRKIEFLRKLMLRGWEDAKWVQKPRPGLN